MAKANKDGWIRHRGGKCPVAEGTLIDVVYRDGVENLGVPACTGYKGSVSRSAVIWDHWSDNADIMRWRLHSSEQYQDPVEVEVPGGRLGDGPLDWRDRIRQIDAEEDKRKEEHRQAIEALEEERLSLVQKLEAEGFKLIDKINAGLEEAKKAHEDMSDPDNWRAGDLIEMVSNSNNHKFKIGELVRIKRLSGESGGMTAEHLDARDWWYVDAIDAKWHSRP